MGIEIRRMVPAELGAVLALRGEATPERVALFAFAAAHPQCEPVVAVEGGELVGSGLGTRNGAAGWVGAIFVAEHRRRAGLGRALTERVLDGLAAEGCRTFVLVASEMGRPLYERMGFEVTDWYVNLDHTDPVAAGAGDRTIDPLTPADVAEATMLDRAATGEDRTHLIATFAGIPGGLAVRDGTGALRAFRVATPWRLGATIAPDPQDVRRILARRAAESEPGHRLRTGLLASNEAGLAMLAADGWVEAWRAPRMQRGEPLMWEPRAIWGQISFAMG